MKMEVGALTIVLMIGSLVYPIEKQQSAIAQTVLSTVSTDPGQLSQLPHSDHPQAAYKSGFQHGVIDGNTSSNSTSYIDQPKHGFAWHSSKFVKVYVNVYCTIPANKNGEPINTRPQFIVLMVQ